jgi:hypothetical protein
VPAPTRQGSHELPSAPAQKGEGAVLDHLGQRVQGHALHVDTGTVQDRHQLHTTALPDAPTFPETRQPQVQEDIRCERVMLWIVPDRQTITNQSEGV